MARNQTLLKPHVEKARPKQKRIMNGRNNLAYVAFRDLPVSRRIAIINHEWENVLQRKQIE